MGYPMTWRRVVGRNGLSEGDYSNPGFHGLRVNPDPISPVDGSDQTKTLAPYWLERAQQYESAFRRLLGDIRRFEQDTTDERTTCQHIAQRTGIDADTVAAVLKEFIAW